MNDRIDSALGYKKADIVLRNAKYVNVFTNELLDGDIAIKDGYFVGIGEYEGNTEIDLRGKTVIPSFIDAHIHLESSIVSPYEFAKAVIPHGTTAVVADQMCIRDRELSVHNILWLQPLPRDSAFLPFC